MKSPIIQKSATFVFNLLREKLPPNYIYHNYNHTVEVVDATIEIADGCDLSKDEKEVVVLAAWFHDAGFIEIYDGHEDKSKLIAEQFLKENFYPDEKINRILGCIEATRYPQQPKNLLEYIICDADLSGIASKKYIEKANFLRQELELVKGKISTDAEWVKSEIDFLTKHKYHTPYAHINFDKRKNLHVIELRARLAELEQSDSKKDKKLQQKEAEALLKEEKQKRPERGIETMFRVTSSNHMNLSTMADSKANILISINAIILSFALANLFTKLDTNPYLVLPTVILLVFCVVSIIFATLSTRPKVTSGRFSRDDIRTKKTNLLFFGNFFNVPLDDFEWGFQEMMKDRDYLYGSMIKDIYFLGKVLGKKYKLLRVAYTIFMWGIITTVVAFIGNYAYYLYTLGQMPQVI